MSGVGLQRLVLRHGEPSREALRYDHDPAPSRLLLQLRDGRGSTGCGFANQAVQVREVPQLVVRERLHELTALRLEQVAGRLRQFGRDRGERHIPPVTRLLRRRGEKLNGGEDGVSHSHSVVP